MLKYVEIMSVAFAICDYYLI